MPNPFYFLRALSEWRKRRKQQLQFERVVLIVEQSMKPLMKHIPKEELIKMIGFPQDYNDALMKDAKPKDQS